LFYDSLTGKNQRSLGKKWTV